MRPKFGSKIRGAKTLVAYSFFSLWTVLQVSLNKGPGRVGLFTNVMNNLLRWEPDWQMEFHPSIRKCQLLRVTNKRKPSPTSYDIHGHKLRLVDAAKYLGITIH
jgi:hypothetical protein